MNAYLENALSLEEYRDMKNKLVNEKQLLKEKLSAFEQKANNRFELTEKFLKTNITNAELANEGIPEEILREFKKVGSNFKILNRTVLFEPRGAWKTLADSGFGGRAIHSEALRADQSFGGNSDFEFLRRERDSNSRCQLRHDGLVNRWFKPLTHSSIFIFIGDVFAETEGCARG